MKQIFFALLVISVFAFGVQSAHAGRCDDWNSSDQVNQLWQGFGVPFNVFTATNNNGNLIGVDPLFDSQCPERGTSGAVSGFFGGKSGNHAIYETAYIINSQDNTWRQINLSPSQAAQTAENDRRIPNVRWQDSGGNDTDYFRYEASGSLGREGNGANDNFKPGADTYVAAYICIQRNNEWKCGCTDEQCTSSNWQIQKYHYEEIN